MNKIEKTLEKALGCQECREFWWSLDEIEEYIKYFKSEAKKKGYKNLGLRFYLGKYGKEHKGHHEHNTMFIAPTGIHAKDSLTKLKGQTVGAMSTDTNGNIYEIEAYNGGHGRIPPKKY